VKGEILDLVHGRSLIVPRYLVLAEVFDGLDYGPSFRSSHWGWQERLGKVVLITLREIPAGLPLAGTIRATMTVDGMVSLRDDPRGPVELTRRFRPEPQKALAVLATVWVPFVQ